jgi:hypothetical protein
VLKHRIPGVGRLAIYDWALFLQKEASEYTSLKIQICSRTIFSQGMFNAQLIAGVGTVTSID